MPSDGVDIAEINPTSASTAVSPSPPVPAASLDLAAIANAIDKTDWPDWVVHHFGRFLDEELPEEHKKVWLDIVVAWVEIEQAQSFKQAIGNMAITQRPVEIKDWVKNGRRHRAQVKAGRVKAFLKGWPLWWAEVNPDWRRMQDGRLTQDNPGSWSSLNHPGTNGLVNVVCALLMYHDISASADWLVSANDVSWTFTQVLAALLEPTDGEDATRNSEASSTYVTTVS
ncbi:hypothetical protein BC629DRAFT_1529839 [Irpex lacteus]|nr:hypothetical protein BC629DRAFT_1529839 [Irpex lacteus]